MNELTYAGGGLRYAGRSVLQVVRGLNLEIGKLLLSNSWNSQRRVDEALFSLDWAADKPRLGANALEAISMAAARAWAERSRRPLHVWIAQNLEKTEWLPVPQYMVRNGDAHAEDDLEFQEFMIAPIGAPTLPDASNWGSEVYYALGDEGGHAPEVTRPEQTVELMAKAVHLTGFPVGIDRQIQVVGDELFAANPDWGREGIWTSSANAVLIETKQIGTVTETLQTLRVGDCGEREIDA